VVQLDFPTTSWVLMALLNTISGSKTLLHHNPNLKIFRRAGFVSSENRSVGERIPLLQRRIVGGESFPRLLFIRRGADESA
jgi:hypothetical protein